MSIVVNTESPWQWQSTVVRHWDGICDCATQPEHTTVQLSTVRNNYPRNNRSRHKHPTCYCLWQWHFGKILLLV